VATYPYPNYKGEIEGGEWKKNRECKDVPPSLFFPPERTGRQPVNHIALKQLTQAQRFCNACPVQRQCLEHALLNGEIGIWGGTLQAERERMRKRAIREARLNVRVLPPRQDSIGA